MLKLKQNVWIVLLAGIFVLLGYGAILVHANNTIKEIKCSLNHVQQIDSLKNVIQENNYEIKALEKSCRNKELEIAYWGRMYLNCKTLK